VKIIEAMNISKMLITDEMMGAYQIDIMLYKIQQAGAGQLLPD